MLHGSLNSTRAPHKAQRQTCAPADGHASCGGDATTVLGGGGSRGRCHEGPWGKRVHSPTKKRRCSAADGQFTRHGEIESLPSCRKRRPQPDSHDIAPMACCPGAADLAAAVKSARGGQEAPTGCSIAHPRLVPPQAASGDVVQQQPTLEAAQPTRFLATKAGGGARTPFLSRHSLAAFCRLWPS